MWKEGRFNIDGVKFFYSAKVFECGSEFGINGGRISKLSVWKSEGDYYCYPLNNLIINYDRGWDIKPRPCNKLHTKALEYVLSLYPI